MRIYVGNLSYHTCDEHLGKIFGAYGPVASVILVTDPETGRSHGYGYVEMPDETTGRLAIASLNGARIDERAIVVRPARERERQAVGARR